MKLSSFDAISTALNDAGVKFLVAGGFAVNAHGFIRTTYDVDIVIQLDPNNIVNAFTALATLGYRPSVPVTAGQFADPAQRENWIKYKGMQVLNFHSSAHQQMPVDVFVTEPFDFEREYEAALQGEIMPGLVVRFVSMSALIEMKKLANRPKDLEDIRQLLELYRESPHEP